MSEQPESGVDWQSQIVSDAAIALFKTEHIQRDVYTWPLIRELIGLGWLEPTEDNQDYALTLQGRAQLPELLDKHLPRWRELAFSGVAVEEPERTGFMKRLEFIRANTRFDLPLWINRKSYNTLYAGRADTDLPEEFRSMLPEFRFSEDAVLRVRGDTDMHLIRKMHKPMRLGALLRQMSQAVLPERDVREVTEIDGEQPYMVMTVENLSVFSDMDIPDHLMLIWAPLDYPDLAVHLLKMIPQYVPHVHFGDLDASGMALAQHIADAANRPVRRFLPDFWQEYINEYAQPCARQEGKGAHWNQAISSHALIRKLMLRKEWLPQSAVLLDPRLKQELNGLMN